MLVHLGRPRHSYIGSGWAWVGFPQLWYSQQHNRGNRNIREPDMDTSRFGHASLLFILSSIDSMVLYTNFKDPKISLLFGPKDCATKFAKLPTTQPLRAQETPPAGMGVTSAGK